MVTKIAHGKAKAETKFGAKLHVSLVDGYARIERLSFDAFNETDDFIAARLENTSRSVIVVALLYIKLCKRLWSLVRVFFDCGA